MTYRVRGGKLTVELDGQGRSMSFGLPGGTVSAGQAGPKFCIVGKEVRPTKATKTDEGIVVELGGDGVSGRWRLKGGDDGVVCVLEADGADAVAVEIDIPLPLSAALELPIGQNWGVRLDRSAPVGPEAGVKGAGGKIQLAAADFAGGALGFIGLNDHTRYLPGSYADVWRASGYRDDNALRLHLRVVSGEGVLITGQPDLSGVIDQYCRSLRQRLGILTLEEDPAVPDWLGEIKVIVLMGMWHSDGTILHDFRDALEVVGQLKSMGLGKGLLVRLSSWQGRFDTRYPFFAPAKELGGAAGMRALSDAVHAMGSRLTVHSNIWGMDPYLEEFEQIEHLAVPYDRCYERIPTGQIGPYDGWPGPYPAQPTGFDSGPLAIEAVEETDRHVVFQTAELPEDMEAYLSVAGVRNFAGGRLRAVVDNRQVKSNPGVFDRDERCRFRFRFRFAPGRNSIRLEFIGGRPDLGKATYRLHGAVRGERLWSHPIVRADIHHPQWTQITRDNLARTVREFDIDVPYLDAVNIWRPSDRGIFDALRDDLPGKVFGCEYSAELGYNMFRMTHVSLGGWPKEGSGHKLSDFPRRVHERFTRLHYIQYKFPKDRRDPPRMPFGILGELGSFAGSWALAEGPSQGVIPCVQLDYRRDGLDQFTREFLLR